ncbi:MAG: YjbE family putative metal transport protein [Burkholderiaceae bacterium]|nr:YjbE family putative metal transport protein [Burkholderiaceae bacterium]
MAHMLSTPEFWIAVGQIIMIDILLGGDNAVVIALACRKLPPKQRLRGILWGTAGAIVLRIVLIFFALQLLAIPFLKIVGALLLVWIGVKLLLPEHDDAHGNIEGSERLWGAVKTVIVADLVMSIDNVIAIAGAAEASGHGHGMVLVIFGVLVSIPIIVWGSQMVIKLMDRFPIVVTLGGMLLGWIAGTMVVTDPAVARPDVISAMPKLVVTDALRYGAGAAGALLVLAIGKWVSTRRRARAVPVPGVAAARAPVGLRRLLLAADGSESCRRATAHVIELRRDLREPDGVELHVVNVQRPLPRDVSTFIAGKTIDEYYQERSEEALSPVRARLDEAGFAHQVHRRVGDPGTVIAELAERIGADLIVMGTRGLGTHTAALIGSVAQSTVAQATVPVMLVK